MVVLKVKNTILTITKLIEKMSTINVVDLIWV